MDQDPLASLHPGVVEKRLPRRQRRQWHGRRLDVVEGRRLGGQLDRARRDVVGVRPVALEVDQTEHRVAGGQTGGVRANRLDDAGELMAGDDR